MARLTAQARVRQVARQRVNALVRRGAIPHPRDSFCFDCREDAAQYDHHRGYEGDAALDVQPVCVKCHVARGVVRGERLARQDERLPGRFHGFGGMVRRTRLTLGITCDELAKRVGYADGGSIHTIETFRCRVAADRTRQLAAVLGIDVQLLMHARPPLASRKGRPLPCSSTCEGCRGCASTAAEAA